ncbi:signal peptidase I [Meiothermus granaticius]|uniref:Signal peptidase I n=1 Tax=Meiothermus granaticius NBRC 107808 TaxID=1227551 RepID=A0A399F8V1_9DEIN|nr:signal peptidase I [Meiothermus granaticius]RIH93097.1 Signal peptidase I T [Meiothermus granaticius NBRC 107808]GEM86628.1 signal peptidase I [Meiothermus granaticius NBRC 107808]
MRNFWDYLFREWFRQVGEALLLAFLVTTFLFTTVGVVGNSMNPLNGNPLPQGALSLQNGERVFVPKYETWLVRFGLMHWKRGEVAIVKPPEGTPNSVAQFPFLGFPFRAFFIKRIIGIPGDTVSIKDGVVNINGKPLNEVHINQFITPYPENYPVTCYQNGKLTALITQQQTRFSPGDLPPYLKPTLEMLVPPTQEELDKSNAGEVCFNAALKLKPGYYFVMGDNRTFGGSEDSRTFGPIPETSIAGRASAVWWPLNKIRALPIPEGFRELSN